jgi:hypothetical protein
VAFEVLVAACVGSGFFHKVCAAREAVYKLEMWRSKNIFFYSSPKISLSPKQNIRVQNNLKFNNGFNENFKTTIPSKNYHTPKTT